MSFTTPIFLFLFFPMTILGYYLIRPNLKNIFLLAASLFFYAWGDPKFFPIFVVSILINYGMALLISYLKDKKIAKRIVLVFSLLINLGILFYFKYMMFAAETVNRIFGSNIELKNIALPLGISFFTFRAISYILDVYWQTSEVQKNPLNVALYISFFPQVTMGPITKSHEFLSQIKERKFDLDVFFDGIKRIIIGMAKKLIIANSVGVVVDHIFSTPHDSRTVLAAWVGIIGYLVQLYFDFSGYSDMVVGLGKMFGFKTPENFDYPFMSKSIVEYWSRWHITLGTWLKDYLYTPVFRTLMNKKKPIFFCDIMGLLTVWIVAGIWHGAAWHFVMYGLYYFFFIALERTIEYFEKKRRKKLKLTKQPETKLHAVLSHIYFVIVLIFGQLMFRIDSLGDYFPYIKNMFGISGKGLTDSLSSFNFKSIIGTLVIGVVFCFPVVKKNAELMERNKVTRFISEYIAQPIIYLALLLISVSYMIVSNYDPFIYQKF